MRRALLALGAVACMQSACVHSAADRTIVDQLDREVLALQARNELLEKRMINCEVDARAPEVYLQLTQVYASTEVTVTRRDTSTLVSVPTNLLLASTGLSLRAEASRVLDLLATALELHPELQIEVVGHTDDVALTGAAARTWPSHFEQTAAQAGVLVRALRDRYHIAPARLTVAGRGSAEPLTENDTPEGRSANRRIVFVLTPRQP